MIVVPVGRKPFTIVAPTDTSVPIVTLDGSPPSESEGTAFSTLTDAGPHATLDGLLAASPG